MSESNTESRTLFERIQAQLVFEDNHLIVVNKLPSQIVQGDKTGDMPLSEMVKEYIRIKYSKPGEVFLGVVHRLDRPVSGVTLFARTSKSLTRMNEILKSREIQKTYWAVVKQMPPAESGTLVNFLRRDEKLNKSFVVKQEGQGAQRAELTYSVIGKTETYYLLEVNLLTGRHHQIRAQLSAMGCPIRGDLKYGFPRSNPDGSIHLHARKVELIHPVKKEKMTFIADPPREKIWDLFRAIMP